MINIIGKVNEEKDKKKKKKKKKEESGKWKVESDRMYWKPEGDN